MWTATYFLDLGYVPLHCMRLSYMG